MKIYFETNLKDCVWVWDTKTMRASWLQKERECAASGFKLSETQERGFKEISKQQAERIIGRTITDDGEEKKMIDSKLKIGDKVRVVNFARHPCNGAVGTVDTRLPDDGDLAIFIVGFEKPYCACRLAERVLEKLPEKFMIGEFEVTSITESGCKVGCTTVTRDDVIRIAKEMGLTADEIRN